MKEQSNMDIVIIIIVLVVAGIIYFMLKGTLGNLGKKVETYAEGTI